MNGMTYIVNSDNKIVRKFECDYDNAISSSFGRITDEGRYFILPKDFPPPYEEVQPTTYTKRKHPTKL